MTKNTLGEIKLSPLKENGKFVFINSEVRINNKMNKGDYIKIFVEGYEVRDGKHFIKGAANPSSKMIVRGDTPLTQEFPMTFETIEDLYLKVGEMYRNQFYFGKTEI